MKKITILLSLMSLCISYAYPMEQKGKFLDSIRTVYGCQYSKDQQRASNRLTPPKKDSPAIKK